MSEGLLTRYMETGFPHLKQVSGLPEWLIPDVAEVAHKLGDQAMLELVEPLGLSDKLKAFAARAPEPNSLPVEIWQEGIARWHGVHQVLPVTMALLRACEKVDALEQRGVLRVGFASLAHGLGTISYAPFAPNGSEILSKLANILGGDPAEPARLLDLYTTAVVKADDHILAGIEDCVLQDPVWAAWSNKLLATGKAFPFIPRVIAVRPPLTNGLMQVLVSMIMEVCHVNSGRNYPN